MGAKRVSTQGVRVSQGNAIEVTNASDAVVFSVDSTGALGKVANLTTTGDILYASSANTPARLGIGTSSQVLTVAGGVPTWATPTVGDITAVTAGTGISGGGTSGDVTITNSMATAIDAKGDLVGGTGADAFARLAVGANGTVLTADSAETTGLKWAAPAASSFVGVRAYKDANQSIADSTATAVTYAAENFDTNSFHDNVTNNSRFTVPSGQGGYYLCIAQNAYANVAATGSREVVLRKNGSTYMTQTSIPGANIARANCVYAVEVLNLVATDYVEVLAYQTSGGSLNLVHDLSTVSYFTMIKVG
jgi:hypothetical protein